MLFGLALACLIYQHAEIANVLTFTRDLLVPANYVGFVVVWLVLKFLHELAHAMTCVAYGCRVKEAGLFFILFAPVAYVDVGGMVEVPSRFRRMHIALAGVIMEVIIAACALWLWTYTSSPQLKLYASQVFSRPLDDVALELESTESQRWLCCPVRADRSRAVACCGQTICPILERSIPAGPER